MEDNSEYIIFGFKLMLMDVQNLSPEPDYLPNDKEFESFKNRFNEWSRLSGEISDNDLKAATELLKKYQITVPRLLLPHIDYPLTLYRARVIPVNSKENIAKSKSFSYPPAQLLPTFQRASAPGFPVFYGAFDGKTALEELTLNGGRKIEPNDTIFLSKWTVKPGHRLTLASLTIPEITAEHQLFSSLTQKVFSEFAELLNKEENSFKKTQDFLFREVNKLFLTGKHVQSGIIAHDILYNTGVVNGIQIDGIMYPSCANQFRSINCALHPDFVDSSLQLETVQKFKFNEFTPDGAGGRSSYYGTGRDQKIIWRTLLTEIKPHLFSVELALEEEWTRQERLDAQCICNGKEFDLLAFCAERADRIDLSSHIAKQEHLELYKAHTPGKLFLEIPREELAIHLALNGRLNQVQLIRIVIPMIWKTRRIACREVLQKKN